jgi:hypothetical protein
LTAAVKPANGAGAFGPYPASAFRVVTGECDDCPTIAQALWYFRDETIAVPKPGLPVASFTPGVATFDEIEAWAAVRAAEAPIDYPPLVWIAAPQIARGTRIAADGGTLVSDDAIMPMQPVAKIPLNRSYYDASSVSFLADRRLTVRGTLRDGTFVMRTAWPEDFRIGPVAPPARAVADALALRELMREAPRGGAQSPYDAHTLWQRDASATDWRGRPVLAFMVNGAQGDDDEAHAGHFALVTGRIGSDGDIGDWLVNNFYTLDSESEKGIIAAPVPLDNYLGDLNSGQNWYRPSYMLVLVLDHERAAALVQSAINRVYNQFYRHQLLYYHPDVNCTSMSVDTLRALGWPVPARGPSNRPLAWVGFPFLSVKERSFGKAKLTFDYLYADQSRLLPAVALEEAYTSVVQLTRGELPQNAGVLARMIADDLAAIAFARIPQFPSSRVFGDAPVVSMKEYHARLPRDPAQIRIVPVPARPFPDSLRDADLVAPKRHRSDYAALIWGMVSIASVAAMLWRLGRKSRSGPSIE